MCTPHMQPPTYSTCKHTPHFWHATTSPPPTHNTFLPLFVSFMTGPGDLQLLMIPIHFAEIFVQKINVSRFPAHKQSLCTCPQMLCCHKLWVNLHIHGLFLPSCLVAVPVFSRADIVTLNPRSPTSLRPSKETFSDKIFWSASLPKESVQRLKPEGILWLSLSEAEVTLHACTRAHLPTPYPQNRETVIFLLALWHQLPFV